MALTWSESELVGSIYHFACVGSVLTLHVCKCPPYISWCVDRTSFCGCNDAEEVWGTSETLDEAKNAAQEAAKKLLTDALAEIGV